VRTYYRQPPQNSHISTPFDKLNITGCYFMHMHTNLDKSDITPESHHHNNFEIHILENGQQKFKVGDSIYSISSGDFILIPPMVSHQIISSTYEVSRFSLLFSSTSIVEENCHLCKIPATLYNNIQFIRSEYRNRSNLSNMLIENRLFEITVSLLRLVGLLRENVQSDINDDPRLISIKEYISDNIEKPITVSDIASYCHLTPKQVTRIFRKCEEKTPRQYIISQRVEQIEKFLANDSLSLKDISERMHFQNEYYFNTFVKKYLGMTPGSYRKMIK